MRIYTYRPPRIRRADFESSKHRKKSHNAFVGISLIALIGFFGYRYFHTPELLSALVEDRAEVASTSSLQNPLISMPKATESPVVSMIPFLKTSAPVDWKLSFSQPQQAVGGGPGILQNVFDTKAGISVNYATGDVYYSYNSDKRMPMASTTKIMTAMVALDLASLDERFTVEEAATKVEPTVVGLRVGEKMSTQELIRAGLLTSGNDAMAVLANGIGKKYGGDESLFIAAMNEKAKILGLTNTHFTNPQGYDDPQHYTTAEELVKLSRYALANYSEIANTVKLKDNFLKANDYHHSINLPNWNMLIDTYPGADGIKIGNTGEAGHTTVASATRSGQRVLSVVLGADGILDRDLAAAELLNVGFQHLGIASYPMTEDLLRVRIKDWY
jgi:D-alanyl-D-alanine carboxypeptidase